LLAYGISSTPCYAKASFHNMVILLLTVAAQFMG
jgi:hypothetical protein